MNNIQTYPQTHDELLSALVDGELNREDLEVLLSESADCHATNERWNHYQLIGNALRSPSSPEVGADAAFLKNFNERLLREQAAFGPEIAHEKNVVSLHSSVHLMTEVTRERGPASNDGNFRWKLVAGFASLAAVSAIGWNALGFLAPASAPQLARIDSVDSLAVQRVVVASPQGPMVRDARLEELLSAHKQMGGVSALQISSGFLRSATFESPRDGAR